MIKPTSFSDTKNSTVGLSMHDPLSHTKLQGNQHVPELF